VDEGFGGVLDFVETLGDLVDRNEKLELVLDFNQVITVVASSSGVLGGINTAGHHNSQRDEVSDDLVDNIANTILTRVGADSGVEHNIAVL
jgi:predicted deacylase